MHTVHNNEDHQRVIDIIENLLRVNIEDVIPKGFKKAGLNRLRWVLIDFGVSHLTLPEMPLMEYVLIASCLEERITPENLLDSITFYRILAARNILKLLNRAYKSNNAVKQFLDLRFEDFLSVIEDDDNMMGLIDLDNLFQKLFLAPSDKIKTIVDVLSIHIEPITMLFERKGNICEVITEGAKEECAVLDAYELYHFIFPFCFSFECPLLFSKDRLSKKYNTTQFGNDYDNFFVMNIREWRERSGRYEA